MGALNQIKEYDEYTITNGTVQWEKESQTSEKEYEKAEKLGCTGTLSVETEIKIVSKTCEGQEVKSVPIPQKMSATSF